MRLKIMGYQIIVNGCNTIGFAFACLEPFFNGYGFPYRNSDLFLLFVNGIKFCCVYINMQIHYHHQIISHVNTVKCTCSTVADRMLYRTKTEKNIRSIKLLEKMWVNSNLVLFINESKETLPRYNLPISC